MAETKKPKYIANVVAKRDGREYWTRVGAVFENGNGEHPFTLVLNPGVSAAEKIVFSVPKAKDEAEAAAA